MIDTLFACTEDSVLQQEVMSLMQLTQDVNAMAEDMDRCSMFEIMLVSAEARGQENGRTEVNTQTTQMSCTLYSWACTQGRA